MPGMPPGVPPSICMTWARMAGSIPGMSSIPAGIAGIDPIIRARMAVRLSRFWLWTAPLTAGAIAALLFGVGFTLALRGSLGEPLGEPPPPPRDSAAAMPGRVDGAVRILVLGDSLAKGTGDESGKGFAVHVLEAFRKTGPAELTNLAVNGMESPEILALVDTPNVRTLAAAASVILLSAGGNDLSHGATRGADSAGAVADAVAKDIVGNITDHNRGPMPVHFLKIAREIEETLADGSSETIMLALAPFRRIVKDYFLVCESYYEATRGKSLTQVEAIDVGRRSLHNEGSALLIKRLAGKVAIDHATARRLFTLICVLHLRA